MIARSRDRARRGRMTAGILLAALATLAAAPLPHAWRNWRYSRPIVLPSVDSPRLAGTVLPEEVFRRSRTSLPDLRIIDDLGVETPYVVQTRAGSTTTIRLPTTIHENSFAPGDYTQIVLDLGDRTKFHDALEIQTPESDYIEWVSVEASDDTHLWRIVQARAPFFRFQKEGLRGTQTISYSENNARYLRVHILDGANQFYVTGVNVLYKTVIPQERIPLEATFAPGVSPSEGYSTWTTDFGSAAMPVSNVQFEVAAPAEFIRNVDISASDDNQEWHPFAQGEIYRYGEGEAAQEQLAVSTPFGETQGRFWKVEIVNGSDAPLEGVVVHVSAAARHVLFLQQPGRTYTLIYGQSQAKGPQYDLVRRLNFTQREAAAVGQVGPEEENSEYSDPRPWTEKNAYFLWVVLGIAVLLLGYSAIRSLRLSSANSTPHT